MGRKNHTRPVPDLEGSTLVHVKDSLFVDSVTGMVLSRVGYTNVNGYEVYNSEGKYILVHRLVYETVVGPIPDGFEINHVDGVKTNNRPDNLETATSSEQKTHAYRIGLRAGNGLTGKTKTRRLTEKQLQQLRDAPRGTIKEMAHEFGISQHYAYQIRAGRRCGGVPGRS